MLRWDRYVNSISSFFLLITCEGNKFHGDTSDSNILKIFRMLDRHGEDNLHYYRKNHPNPLEELH